MIPQNILAQFKEMLLALDRALKAYVDRVAPDQIPPPVPPPAPVAPPKPVPPPNSYLNTMCLAIQRHEGWFAPSTKYPRGSRSYQNLNPGNLRAAPNQAGTRGGFAYFHSYTEGFAALKALIVKAASGKSKYYRSNMTLIEFFNVYAPASDNNSPNAYAHAVAASMGVNAMKFRISQLL